MLIYFAAWYGKRHTKRRQHQHEDKERRKLIKVGKTPALSGIKSD